MKILHVIPSLDCGGAEHLTLNLAKAQQELGHQVSVCCVMSPPDKGALYEKARALGIPCYFSFSKHEPHVITTWKMMRLFRQLCPDVIQSHLPRANSCSAIAARLAGIHCIIATFHNPLIWKNSRQKKWGVLTSRFQHGIFCDAEIIRRRLLEMCPHVESRTRVVYPSIPLSKVFVSQEEQDMFKSKWGIEKEDRLVGIVARLAEVKDHATFIDAAEIVLKSLPKVKFLISGDGPMKQHLQSLIKEKALQDKILLLGFVPDLDCVWSLLDLFVLTSLSEGFPVSILEAFAAGLPVIATNVGGIPEIIIKGENGFLVEPGQPGQIAEKILALLWNKSLHEKMRESARQTAHNFQIEKMAEQTITFYKEVSR
jgi:glycosyltransferase involved in cell wall biosynthesis